MDPQSDIFSSGLKVDATAKEHIRGLASWAMLVVAATVLGYVLNIAGLIISGGNEPAGPQPEGFSGALLSGEKNVAGTIITVLIGLAVNYFLYRFASTVNGAATAANSEKFGSSFRHLRIYFAITSIFMMLFLLIMLIVVVALL